MTRTYAALWRRLDEPGHDACELIAGVDGCELHGTAVFRHALGPARLDYSVRCERDGRSRSGQVRGWIANRHWHLQVHRLESGEWLLNDTRVDGLDACLDLDFGFTPATNVLTLRRLALEVGAAADVPVAWLDLPEASLVFLPQTYQRRSATTYWYESPTAGYTALLEVADSGFVTTYPGLWVMEERGQQESQKC